jgi:CBS domain-containing protein
MKVKKLMKTNVGFCNPQDDLTEAARIMWQKDCGVVPVVDDKKKVLGMITDRDICIAVASREQLASQIKAAELINSKKVISCSPDDKIETALRRMKKNKIKRLPVVEKNGELVGILSITDLLISVRKNKDLKKQIYSTLKTIGKPHRIVLKEIAKSET